MTLCLGLENASYGVMFSVSEDLLVVLVRSELRVPKARLPQASEFVIRANFGLRVGAFDLDLDDRDITFRAATLTCAGVIAVDAVEQLLDRAVVTMDEYYPGLCAVAFAGQEPKTAIETIEQRQEEEEP